MQDTNNDSPLIQALKNKQSRDPQAVLDFILAHFDLVPKDEEDKPEMVMTQQSHAA